MTQERTRIVAGCMTGTSLDGLDAALVKITGRGLAMKAELLNHVAQPLPDKLRGTLLSLASGKAHEPMVYMQAARSIGEVYASGIEQLLAEHPDLKCEFVTAHGQTIWHAPRDEQGPKSWQLFDPWPIVKRLGVPVCYDLRQADLIAGGEGAPLTPIADWVMYREHADVVANLGGVLNVTNLHDNPSQITGGDLYPCNLLLDGLCQRYFNQPYDTDGEIASRGKLNPKYVDTINEAIQQAIEGHASLGREQFSPDWFDALMHALGEATAPEDVLHTAARLVAVQLGGEFREHGVPQERLVLAGGGAKNKTLVRLIEELGYRDVFLSDDLGIPCEAREAMGFAVLGALSQDGVPISLSQVTGSTDSGVAGVWAGTKG
ncbi:MAG: anhydro-N-acetylmuramic acid kinase [Phycisphaeraceae bacterium]